MKMTSKMQMFLFGGESENSPEKKPLSSSVEISGHTTQRGRDENRGKTIADSKTNAPCSPNAANFQEAEGLPTPELSDGKTDHNEDVTERSAIHEFDAGILKERAEEMAVAAKGCYSCKGKRFWLSTSGNIVCGACHPPAMPELVTRWIEMPGR